MRGYKDILIGTLKKPKASVGVEVDENTLKNWATANELAYNDLLLSCQNEVSFGAVDEAITEDLPDGDAAKA